MGSKASGDVYFVLAEERPFQAEGTAQRRQAHPPPHGLCLGRNSNSGQTSNSSEMGHRVTRGQSMTSLAVPLWEKMILVNYLLDIPLVRGMFTERW